MTFSGEKFYSVGDHLEEHSNDEEYQRSAVGRFYYACYWKCRDYFEKKTNRRLGKKKPHKKLIDYFKDSQNETEKKIGRNLSNLKSSRIKADYKNGFKNNSVRDSKVKAEKVFELFKDLED